MGKTQPEEQRAVRASFTPDKQWGRSPAADATQGCDMASCDANLLQATVLAVTQAGALISFAATRSGRAVRVTILDGPAKSVEYANSPEELTAVLRTLQEQAMG